MEWIKKEWDATKYKKIWQPGEKRGRHLQKGEVIAGGTIFTKETGAQLARIAIDKRKARAAEGMLEAVNEILEEAGRTGKVKFKAGTPEEAYKQVIKHITKTYMKSNVLKSMSDAGSFISKATGMFDEKEEVKGTSVQDSGLEDARILLQVFNYYQDGQKQLPDVVDATIVEPE
jgi:hypothetical protein